MTKPDCTTWRPLHDTIVVHWPEGAEKSKGGIIKPAAVRQQMRPARGEVLAVGTGRIAPETGTVVPMKVKVGDSIVFNAKGCVEHELDDGSGKVYLMSELNVFAVISPIATALLGI